MRYIFGFPSNEGDKKGESYSIIRRLIQAKFAIRLDFSKPKNLSAEVTSIVQLDGQDYHIKIARDDLKKSLTIT